MRFKFCKNPSCRFWHLPCLNYNSGKGCVYGDKCLFRHVEADVKPNKKSKKGGAKQEVDKQEVEERSLYSCVMYLKILIRENLFNVNLEYWDQNTLRERKGPSRGIIQKCAPHERGSCAPKFEDRSHEETLNQERCARKAAWDFAKKTFASSRIRTKLGFMFLAKSKVCRHLSLQRDQKRVS